MKIIKQIGIVFSVCWLSVLVEKILPFAFPASVIGMILLFVCLISGTYPGEIGFPAGKYGVLLHPGRGEHY